jgi:predicted nucleotide-binding protein
MHELSEHRPALTEVESGRAPEMLGDQRRVYVVHGRNTEARDAMHEFLQALGLQPLEWNQAAVLTANPATYIGPVLQEAFSQVQAIVILMTPDDEAKLRGPFLKSDDALYERTLTPQARPNVLFEAGMAMGGYEKQTILVELGQPLRPFSDIGGRHTVRLDDSTASRQVLAQRLEMAGCKVDMTGISWHTAGRFEAAVLTPPAGVYVYDGDEAAKKQVHGHLKNLGIRVVDGGERSCLLPFHDWLASLRPEMNAAIVVAAPRSTGTGVITWSTESVYFLGLLQGLLGPDHVIVMTQRKCGLCGVVTVQPYVSYDPGSLQQSFPELDLALKKAGALPWRP